MGGLGGRFRRGEDGAGRRGQNLLLARADEAGQPLAFGYIAAEVNGAPRTVPLLGMPGNPVSSMISFELFARPAILTMLGVQDVRKPTCEAILDQAIPHKDGRRHYVRLRLERRADDFHAVLTGDQGSGILNSMVQSNALAIIPEDWDHAPAGARVQVMPELTPYNNDVP